MPRKKAEESFETMMARLAEVAELMESRDIGIEKAMELYEEGFELIKRLRAVLDAAEEKVRLLGQDGKPGESTAGEKAK